MFQYVSEDALIWDSALVWRNTVTVSNKMHNGESFMFFSVDVVHAEEEVEAIWKGSA